MELSAAPRSRLRTVLWMAVSIALGILALWWYFRYEQYTSAFIRSLGPYGVLAAILLMAILCIVPFPAEFLMIIDMQVYGVWLGILFVWLGAMLASYGTFLIAKRVGSGWVTRIVPAAQVNKLNRAVKLHGASGLLMARLVPFIPFVVLNYASAMLPEVGTWTYLWTTGLGIMPYDLGAALIFLGFSQRLVLWLVVGGIAIVLIWLAALALRARQRREPA